jgi:hypothetical protein
VESNVRLALKSVVLANLVFTLSHKCVHVRLDWKRWLYDDITAITFRDCIDSDDVRKLTPLNPFAMCVCLVEIPP